MTHGTRIAGCYGLVIAVTCLSTHAPADQVSHATSVPLTSVNCDVPVPTPKFDTALGTLVSVSVSIEIQASVSAGIENLDAGPALVALILGAEGEAYAADNGVFCVATSGVTTSNYSLGAYDGTTDHAGASGASIATTMLSSTTNAGSRTDSTVLGLYSGPPGSPGTAETRVRATDVGQPTPTGNFHTTFVTSAAFVSVTVTYEYEPRVTGLCFGDGTGAACPCSNESSAQTGCLNSFGWGSLLSAVGGSAVGADSLVLSATVPGTNAAMFFQGTSAANSGSGAVFGDGLRCTDGTVIRLVTTAGVGGVATFPASGDPLVSVAGSVPSGATRYYQVWYRNSAAFCTEETFNLSNALRVDWGT